MNKYLTDANYCLSDTVSTGTTIMHPPTLWLGGVSIATADLPQDVPARVFSSLSGCIYNATYTHTSSVAPSLLTADDSVANM